MKNNRQEKILAIIEAEPIETQEQLLSKLQEQGIQITDDASVVEMFTESRVKLVEASYQNIKITTPEDLDIAEAFLKHL